MASRFNRLRDSRSVIVALLLLGSTAFLFQNCSPLPAGEDGSSKNSQSSTDSAADQAYNPISPSYVSPYTSASSEPYFENSVAADLPVLEGEGADNSNILARVGSVRYGASWVGLSSPPALNGDSGSNTIACDASGNTVNAYEGDDVVTGTMGADVILGNQGRDTLYGGQNRDSIFGGQDDDQIFGGQGQDRLEGNLGNDTIQGDGDSDTLFGNAGNDILYGNLGNDVLFGNEDNDVLYGGQDHDLLLGGQGDDVLYGNLGHDVLVGGKGNNRSSGGDGNDVYYFQPDESSLEIFDETSGIDTLVCNGVTAASYAHSGTDMILTMSNGGRITIRGQFTGSVSTMAIERFVNCGTPSRI